MLRKLELEQEYLAQSGERNLSRSALSQRMRIDSNIYDVTRR
jgi:hypothetical protein